ncbi:MAG: type IV pilus assembly protein PilM [Candidatus Omnitrophota bacterium]|nr:type IV pilus assembly protein PilM [Candidatus Omnitrophota bacterium]
MNIESLIPNGFFSKEKYSIGLDIGASSIKLAQFKQEEGVFSLIKVKSIDIEKNKEPARILKELFSGPEAKNSKVVALLDSPYSMLKRAIVPMMPDNELKEAVSLEAKNYFPFPIEDSLVDFEVIGDLVENGVKKKEILVGVCPHKAIAERVRLFNELNLKPRVIINSALAMFNLLKFKKFKENLSVAAIDIGKSLSNLIIIRAHKLYFNREIPISGDDFTRALTSALSTASGKIELSYLEAERIKKEYGIPREINSELVENKISHAQLHSLLMASLEKLATEIGRSFDFYREETGGIKVDRLILFGGSAMLKGLDKFLAKELAIEVEVYNSWEGIKASKELNDHPEISRMAMAVGAGINKAEGINFLPFEIREDLKRLMERAALKAGLSAAITILVLTFVGLRLSVANLDKKINAVKSELSFLNTRFGEAKERNLINDVLSVEPYWEDVFKEIGNGIPDEIYLTQMSAQGGSVTLKGVIASGRDQQDAFSGFIRKLEAGIFRNIKFSAAARAAGQKEFEVQMQFE